MGDDLQRFAEKVRGGASIEALSPTESRVRWHMLDRSGQTQIAALRSGISLMTAQVRWDRPWSLAVNQGASPIKFMLLRGEGPRLTAGDGPALPLWGGTFHVSQIKRPVALRFDFEPSSGTSHHAEVGLEIERARLCELLGTTDLPRAVGDVLQSASTYPTSELSMGASLFRLFDELSHCDARGRSRQLLLEAKAMELLAALVDVLDDEERAPRLSPQEVDRLERARQLLVARLAEPPTLPALARSAGVSETKLKAGFRVLFGSPVYTYLRAQRMVEAQRLLRERRYSVVEVALRVGYVNPSKFAAAYRKHFGVPPARS
jgi:AraC family transcriptional activator of pyochelin receptor